MTPALVLLLAGESVDVNVMAMFPSIVQVVILPILAGFAVSHWFGQQTQKVTPLLPMVSTLAVAAIIGIVVSHNAQNILGCRTLALPLRWPPRTSLSTLWLPYQVRFSRHGTTSRAQYLLGRAFFFELVLGKKEGKMKVKASTTFSMLGYTKMDLGIAKLHFEIGAGRENFEWAG